MKKNIFPGLALIVITFIATATGGCSSPVVEEVTEIASPTSTPVPPDPTLDVLNSPTAFPSATATISATSTAIPSPTNMPSPSPSVEPVLIDIDNVGELKVVEEIGESDGNGRITAISVSENGKQVLYFGEKLIVSNLESGVQKIFQGDYFTAALSPDGSRLAMAAMDGGVEIRTVDGQPSLTRLAGGEGVVEALAWSPNGERLAGYVREAGLLIWDGISAELVGEFAFENGMTTWLDEAQLKWSPDSKKVSIAGIDNVLRVVDGTELITLKGFERPVTHADWSPDGTRLAASSSHSPTVIVWRASNWSQILIFSNHQYWVSNVTWSPDGQYLATADAAGTAFIRNASNGSILHYFPNMNSPDLISWSPTGQYLLEMFYNGIKIYDISKREQIALPETTLGVINNAVWIPNSDRILLHNTDSRVQVWDLTSGETELLIDPLIGNIVALAWSADGEYLAMGEHGGGILLYDISENRLANIGNKQYPNLMSLSWAPESDMLSISTETQIAVIEPASGETLLTIGDDQYRIYQDWSHAGDFILSGNWHGKIQRWDPYTGQTTQQWNPLADIIRGIDFSPDDQKAVVNTPLSITLWEAETGKLIRTRQFGLGSFVDNCQWSPEGSRLACLGIQMGDPNSIPQKILYILDAETLEDWSVIEIEGGGFSPSYSADMAWSAGGELLALGSGEIRDGQTGELLYSLRDGGRVTWSPDGYSLFVISDSIEIWQVEPDVP